jgi:small subunit ribosomal protein S2
MQKTDNKPFVDELFEVGAHFGYSKSRRHPSVAPFIFGAKNRFEIVDLEKTGEQLSSVLEYVAQMAREKKQILFVASKQEAVRPVKDGAEKIGMPYVAGRWIGGSLTNFPEIRKRVEMMLQLQEERDKGLLAKYTKKERLLIDRKIEKLEKTFSGLVPMTKKPHAMFVVDSRHEDIAVAEARVSGVPVIALAGTDCDLSKVDHAIVANDSLERSITYVVNKVVETYQKNLAA